ncbi:MAG: 2-(1,2-epoxy-1,2-dihydrophenyl)acetyl-CoA isomerase [Proteobacteria bacterium]|nr:2-(1,2-epoxy-1,2-dihydrophenyl)acetyl-CoA isomerase [Pseudomonadota bacterium]
MTQPILTHLDAGVLTITLNRPDKLNSFNPEMHRLLRAALDDAARNPEIRCVLLTGAGRGFCAGQDLSEREMKESDKPRDLGATIEQYYNPLVKFMQALPLPIVCAVNGVAAGAGANIALACDIVLAARSASFLQAFAKIGLVPDSGGTYFLPRLVGTGRAMALAMLAEKLPAADAERMGLIWKAFDDDKLMAEATAMCRHLATQPTRALGLMKQAIYAAGGNSLSAQLDLERDLQREAGGSPDYREGVTAFLEKRKPVFTGR